MCEICMCLAWDGMGSEWVTGLCLGPYQSGGNMGSDGRVSGLLRFGWCRYEA